MKTAHDIIIRPVITEKAMDGIANMVYTFEVLRSASKTEIKHAIEEIFKVTVVDVNTQNVSGKFKRMGVHSGYRSDWKKAIVKLSGDSKPLEFFEGMI